MADGRGGAASVYVHLVRARVRSDWQYRTSFVLFTLSVTLVTLLDFLAIAVIFSNIPRLAGWSLAEVAFLYGVAGVAFALGDTFVSQVEYVARHVKQGTFDRFLVRPVGPLLQICADEFAFRRAGKLVQSGAILVGAMVAVHGAWTPGRLLATAATVLTGSVIFSEIWVITSSIAFWTVDTQEVANSFTYGGNYMSQYPLDVFGPWLRRLAIGVVPIAFVAYLPSLWILDKNDSIGLPAWLSFAAPAVAALLLVPARLLWRTGIRRYRSTGS
ncbi:MAG TPA: ABC transporter permease [Acidimicrobiales bacterium]|nr:ABC transporter permease [Acidimicrobiales bacterium]